MEKLAAEKLCASLLWAADKNATREPEDLAWSIINATLCGGGGKEKANRGEEWCFVFRR